MPVHTRRYKHGFDCVYVPGARLYKKPAFPLLDLPARYVVCDYNDRGTETGNLREAFALLRCLSVDGGYLPEV